MFDTELPNEPEEEFKLEVPYIPPPIEEDRIKTSYECKGINIQLHFLKLYVPATHARIQCTLYDGTSIVKAEDQKMCNWASKPVDANNIMFTRGDNPINAGLSYTPGGMARGEIL